MMKYWVAGVLAIIISNCQTAAAQERQNVFNDDNYTPKPIMNSLPPPRQTAPAPTQTRPTTRGITGTKYPVNVRWVDARNRSTIYTTHLDYENSVIDTWSLCTELHKGSIEYRTCRKAAKTWLSNKCRSREELSRIWRRMYCSAAETYRP